MKSKHYGLIGYPLTHSFSPSYFANKFKEDDIKGISYDLFPLENLDDLPFLMESLDGLNVTIPYKEEVIPFLDSLSEEAQAIGAVNCIKIEGGKSIGYNTDYFGFKKSLLGFLGEQKISKALVLGTGGASKAVCKVLIDLNITYQLVSRSKPYLTYDEIDEETLHSHHLIVNTTPLGMASFEQIAPKIDYNHITSKHFFYDLIYNPEKTLFLKCGLDQGASIKNGLEMLHFQAEKSWEIWTY